MDRDPDATPGPLNMHGASTRAPGVLTQPPRTGTGVAVVEVVEMVGA